MIPLSASVRIVMLQFNFTDPAMIPETVRLRRPESPREQGPARENAKRGELVIEPTPNCSIADFVQEVHAARYTLVDAFCVARATTRLYYTVRFSFARKDYATSSPAFEGVRREIRNNLREICRHTTWQLRAFSNPFYQNGGEVSGQRVVSIDMNDRRPLVTSIGEPVMVKDRRGYVPRIPDHLLRIEGEVVSLVRM